MGLINLGSIALEGFEVPSCVEFGGKQRVIVHRLLGGARVIDAMGRDDAVLQWRGILSGVNAADRARSLDVMRTSGAPQLLTWDAFCYAVVLSELRLSFHSPWWIPYEAICTVQQDLAFKPQSYVSNFATDILADLTQVNQLLASSDFLGFQSTPLSLPSDQADQMAIVASTLKLQSVVAQSIAGAEAGMNSEDVASIVSSAGTLAQLCCAQSYLDRSISNMTDMAL